MTEPLEARSQEQQRLVELARAYVEMLSDRLPLVAAAVVGSVARGDFNVWSDVDVVVVAEQLPERAPDRTRVLAEAVPGGVQPVGFTPEEFGAALERRNPLATEAVAQGVWLVGAEFFHSRARQS